MIYDKSKPIYWIIAGTWNEYEDYVRDIRRNHPERLEQYTYRYVNDPIMLRGLLEIHGSFIGTWYLKPEATQIWSTIRASHMKYHDERTDSMDKARMVLEHHGKPIGARGAD